MRLELVILPKTLVKYRPKLIAVVLSICNLPLRLNCYRPRHPVTHLWQILPKLNYFKLSVLLCVITHLHYLMNLFLSQLMAIFVLPKSDVFDSSAFFKEFSLGGKSKNCSEIWDVKFASSVARPPEWCELGRLGMCGKLPLKGAPGGGEFFLLYVSLRCVLMYLQFKICRKK